MLLYYSSSLRIQRITGCLGLVCININNKLHYPPPPVAQRKKNRALHGSGLVEAGRGGVGREFVGISINHKQYPPPVVAEREKNRTFLGSVCSGAWWSGSDRVWSGRDMAHLSRPEIIAILQTRPMRFLTRPNLLHDMAHLSRDELSRSLMSYPWYLRLKLQAIAHLLMF